MRISDWSSDVCSSDLGARGDDRMELDLGAEWRGTVREQRLDRAEHRRPRAVVGVEAVLAAVFAHVLASHQVAVEVAAAESVERMLGITDQAKTRRLREGASVPCGQRGAYR